MFMRLMATVILAVPLLAACATPAPTIETAPAATPQTATTQGAQARCTVPAPAEKPGFTAIQVYFTCDDDLRPATPRAVPRVVPTADATVRVALDELLKGPNEAERAAGLSSVFSPKTAGMLHGVATQNGRVIIDLKDLSATLPSLGTSAGTHQLLNELGMTIAQFNSIQEIEYRVDGSCERFWYQLKMECHVIPTRTLGQQEPPLPLGVPLPLVAPKGLADLTPEQFAKFDPVVSRYFHYRKQAVIAQDVTILHREYPDLKSGTDELAGINAESDVVAQYRGLDVVDGNVEAEHYARFQVYEDGDTTVLLVNAMEMYQRKDSNRTGGQIQFLLFLERRGGVWTVVKTDETTLAEYHQALDHH
jgi:hypothetical protein